MPFTVWRARRGGRARRAIRITALCGFGPCHRLGAARALALVFGVELLGLVGQRMAAVAGLLLIAFGLVYGALGLRRLAGRHLHGHHHHHYDHVHEPSAMTPWALFLLYSADPCVALIPILFAAVPLGVLRTTGIVCAYEVATIGTMVALVVPGCAAVSRVRLPWAERYGDAAAGAVIASVGALVVTLGW